MNQSRRGHCELMQNNCRKTSSILECPRLKISKKDTARGFRRNVHDSKQNIAMNVNKWLSKLTVSQQLPQP
jgi:hypothetical protein